ncbi:MAG: hypothetical protein NC489_37665 [Ruminococcus flavefaciens]|nr:hypothetical protein [Ruminococcus flavefaciens]
MAFLRNLLGIILVIGMLLMLAACAPSLYSKNEVLEILSERYGEEFVIVETLNNKLPLVAPSSDLVKEEVYSVASSSDPANVFWVQQEVAKRGGLFVTYARGVEDTLTFDYFLRSFCSFLQTNKIDSFFAVGHEEIEVIEYLTEPHLQGGIIYIYITEETAPEIVTKIFDFINTLYDEYPSKDEFKKIHLGIRFYDKSKITRHELYESSLYTPTYRLYDPYDEDETDIASMLEDINIYYYGNPNG